MTENEYRECEPLYDDAKATIPTWKRISVAAVQRHYRWGYNRASRMLEQLAEVGALNWNKVTGAYTSAKGKSEK